MRTCSRVARLVVLTVLAVVAARPAQAQLPQPRLQGIFPMGVRAGSTADVTLRGTDLEGVNALWFDHPGPPRLPPEGGDVPGRLRPGDPRRPPRRPRGRHLRGEQSPHPRRGRAAGNDGGRAEQHARTGDPDRAELGGQRRDRRDRPRLLRLRGQGGGPRLPRPRGRADREPARRHPPRLRPGGPRDRREPRRVRRRPVPGPDPAGRRPLRRQGPRRRLRRVDRPPLPAHPPRRPASRRHRPDGRGRGRADDSSRSSAAISAALPPPASRSAACPSNGRRSPSRCPGRWSPTRPSRRSASSRRPRRRDEGSNSPCRVPSGPSNPRLHRRGGRPRRPRSRAE